MKSLHNETLFNENSSLTKLFSDPYTILYKSMYITNKISYFPYNKRKVTTLYKTKLTPQVLC